MTAGATWCTQRELEGAPSRHTEPPCPRETAAQRAHASSSSPPATVIFMSMKLSGYSRDPVAGGGTGGCAGMCERWTGSSND